MTTDCEVVIPNIPIQRAGVYLFAKNLCVHIKKSQPKIYLRHAESVLGYILASLALTPGLIQYIQSNLLRSYVFTKSLSWFVLFHLKEDIIWAKSLKYALIINKGNVWNKNGNLGQVVILTHPASEKGKIVQLERSLFVLSNKVLKFVFFFCKNLQSYLSL